MAHPETKRGYTGMANELIEAMYHDPLHPVSTRILLWVVRNTYGWFDRKEKRPRVTCAFSWTLIAKDINLDRSTVSRAGRRLVATGRLRLDARGRVGVQKDYEQWKKCERGGLRGSLTGGKITRGQNSTVTVPPLPRLGGAKSPATSNAREKKAVKKVVKQGTDPPLKSLPNWDNPLTIFQLARHGWPLDPREHPGYLRVSFANQERLVEDYEEHLRLAKYPYPSLPDYPGVCARCSVEHGWTAECFAPWAKKNNARA